MQCSSQERRGVSAPRNSDAVLYVPTPCVLIEEFESANGERRRTAKVGQRRRTKPGERSRRNEARRTKPRERSPVFPNPSPNLNTSEDVVRSGSRAMDRSQFFAV